MRSTPLKEQDPAYQFAYPEDEIDLFELAREIWKQRSIVLATMAIVTLLATFAAFMIPATWQAEVRIYEGTLADLAAIHDLSRVLPSSQGGVSDNLISTGSVSNITPEQALRLYFRYLSSPAILRSVFQKSGLSEQLLKEAGLSDESSLEATALLKGQFDAFQENLSMKPSDKTKEGANFITVKYNSNKQEFSAQLINNYLLPLANAGAIEEIKTNSAYRIDRERIRITQQITDIENQFIQNMSVERLKLIRALEQAEEAGISSFFETSFIAVDDSNRFILGSKILSKQLQQITEQLSKYRMFSDPVKGDEELELLPNVYPLYRKLEKLNKYVVAIDDTKLGIIDEPAMVPAIPASPNKKLIVMLGIVLGGFAGLLIVLVRISIQRRVRDSASLALDTKVLKT